jgi:hypothetical protein
MEDIAAARYWKELKAESRKLKVLYFPLSAVATAIRYLLPGLKVSGEMNG